MNLGAKAGLAGKWILSFLGLAVFALALHFIHGFLEQHSYREIVESLRQIPAVNLAAALGVAALGYLALSLYDILAFTYAGIVLPKKRIMFGSFVAFAFSNTIGLANLAGGSVRMRIYSSYGVEPLKILKVIAFVSASFWIGFFALAGVVFACVGVSVPEFIPLPAIFFRWIGVAFVAAICAYLAYSAAAKQKIRIGKLAFEVPPLRLSLPQILVAAADWALAGATLYFLLPSSVSLSFPAFLSIFLSAQVIAILSHVPGGIGILESLVIYFVVPDHHAAPPVVASLVAFRLLYYFLPFVLASFSLMAYEAYLRRNHVITLSRWSVGVMRPLIPAISGALVFFAGAILLFSSSTPNLAERSRVLDRLALLPLLEISHFLSSCVGVALVVVALGLMGRSRGAWGAALALLAAGGALSLAKGLDFEEALFLGVVFLGIYHSRAEFYRPARIFRDRWKPRWVAALVAILGCAVWLGFFSYRDTVYSQDLWWSFSAGGDASRFLRSLIGGAVTLTAILLYRLLSPPSQPPPAAVARDLSEIAGPVRESRDTLANLALLGDKLIFQSPSKSSFLMYAVQGRSWIVLGDPVGKAEEFDDLLNAFLERVDIYQGKAAFYQVRAEFLPLYIDAGFNFLKLGEEARVKLEDFSLEGRGGKGLRQAYNRMQKQGIRFRISLPGEWPALENEVKKVSDAWLGGKTSAEKGFSLGFFDPRYLSRYSLALIELDGKILAFANVWEGADHEELSIDLMRYLPDGPHGLMEQLMVELMLWGKSQGYRYFNLGMAPLSGLESRRLSPSWNRVGSLLFEHGEKFYNFQGLRRYKEKFHPEWEPRFLAYPGRLALPVILKDLTLLISGGTKGVISK